MGWFGSEGGMSSSFLHRLWSVLLSSSFPEVRINIQHDSTSWPTEQTMCVQVCTALAGVAGAGAGVGSVFFFFTLLSHSPPPAHELLAELAPASLFQMLMTSGSESLKLDH